MKQDTMLLVGAVALAGLVVASKSGMLKKMSAASAPGSSMLDSFRRLSTPFSTGDRTGYDPANPGAYVPVDDLVAGAIENDWGYIPTFNQQVDAVLGGHRQTGNDSVIRVPTPW